MYSNTVVYQNITQCANSTGVPLDILLIARNHKDSPKGGFGFDGSYRIYWNVPNDKGITLEKWIQTHIDELRNFEGLDDQQLKRKKEWVKLITAEIELEEKLGSIVPKDVVKELLKRIGEAQVSLFNGKLRQELPARFNMTPEQIAVLDGMISEIFAVHQNATDKWK